MLTINAGGHSDDEHIIGQHLSCLTMHRHSDCIPANSAYKVTHQCQLCSAKQRFLAYKQQDVAGYDLD